jgi:hypothetical protein
VSAWNFVAWRCSSPIACADDLTFQQGSTRIHPAHRPIRGPVFWYVGRSAAPSACPQGAVRARSTVLCADTTVVHLLVNGVRLKTVPFRLSTAQPRQLLADGSRTPTARTPVDRRRPAGPTSSWTGWSAPTA